MKQVKSAQDMKRKLSFKVENNRKANTKHRLETLKVKKETEKTRKRQERGDTEGNPTETDFK